MSGSARFTPIAADPLRREAGAAPARPEATRPVRGAGDNLTPSKD